jgi:hypothetical protein
MRLPSNELLAAVAWALVVLLFAIGVPGIAFGVEPLVIAFVLVGLPLPFAGPLVAIGFDRWARGHVPRLLTASLALCALASAVLLMLPAEETIETATATTVGGQNGTVTEPVVTRTTETRWFWLLDELGPVAIVLVTVPVAVTALPLATYWLLRRRGRGGKLVIATAASMAAAVLLPVIVFGIVSLVGLFYVPAFATMAAAALRSWTAKAAGLPA